MFIKAPSLAFWLENTEKATTKLLFVITMPGLKEFDLFSLITQALIINLEPLISINPPVVEKHLKKVQLENKLLPVQ